MPNKKTIQSNNALKTLRFILVENGLTKLSKKFGKITNLIRLHMNKIGKKIVGIVIGVNWKK